MLGSSIMRSVASRSREVIFSFTQPWRGHTGSSSGLPSTRDMDILETAQQKATKMTKGLEHLSDEERLRQLRLFSLEKGPGGMSSVYINISRESAKRTDSV